ncbi:hypothetical protein [Pseudomonas sp. TMP25]|uniref:hypothetical protein n=1 Tax=Pseudomonas sp. TMP25 TaxID=3136561 RepID=UPI00310126FE
MSTTEQAPADSDDVLARARRQISRIATTKRAIYAIREGERQRVLGWLGALLAEGLISESDYLQLEDEVVRAFAAVKYG